MTTVTVKNIPDALYTRLKASAQANRRSVNSEIIICIERAVSSYRVDPDGMIAKARRLRELTHDHPISHDEFNAAKNMGRA